MHIMMTLLMNYIHTPSYCLINCGITWEPPHIHQSCRFFIDVYQQFYQDFPLVIQRVQQLIEDLLQRKPLDINQLIAWIEQVQVSYTNKI